jgi:hypothetical protein
MRRTYALAVVLSLALPAGCGSSRASDSAVKTTVERGAAHLRKPQTTEQLHNGLVRTLRQLRDEHASTATGRNGRALAIGGFTWTLRGIDARLEMTRNDSGNLEGSVRDAVRADRDLRKGARLLRAAGRSLGIRIGKLNGF